MTDTKTPPADDLVRRQSYERTYGLNQFHPALVAIEALQAERVDWARRFKLNDVTPWEWMTRAEAAEARAAAAEVDAQRYRWLRDHKGNNRVPHVTQHPYVAAIDDVEYPYFIKVGLDAAIDAARAAQDAGKT